MPKIRETQVCLCGDVIDKTVANPHWAYVVIVRGKSRQKFHLCGSCADRMETQIHLNLKEGGGK